MEIFDYIKNYSVLNPAIIKSLGGSEELMEYISFTPWNTNLNVIGSFTQSESPEPLEEKQKVVFYGMRYIVEDESDLKTGLEVYNYCEENKKEVDEKWVVTSIDAYLEETPLSQVSSDGSIDVG